MSILKIDVNENLPIEKAIKKFKRLCDEYGVVKRFRDLEEYKKPSVRSKEKREAAAKRRMKAQMKLKKTLSKV